MILNRAIKMRIYPNDEQRHKIDATLGHCRYIYNKMLERNTVIYKRRKEHLSLYGEGPRNVSLWRQLWRGDTVLSYL